MILLLAWHVHYAALVNYGKQYGTCNVSRSYGSYKCELPGLGENGGIYHYIGNLGRWLEVQRLAKKGKTRTHELTHEQIQKLQILVDQGIYKYIFSFIYY